MNRSKLLAWAVGGLALLAALLGALPQGKVRGFDLHGAASLPVLEGGRVKPLDSLARNSLLVIRSQQAFRHEGRTVQATEWLLDVLLRPQVADQQPAFVINDPDVLGLIGQRQTSNRYFSFATLTPHIAEIERQAQASMHLEPQQRDRFQSAIVNLYQRMLLYHRLQHTLQIPTAPSLAEELSAPLDAPTARRQEGLVELAHFRPLLPLQGQPEEAWASAGEALRNLRAGSPAHPGLAPLARLGAAWTAQDPAAFNTAVAELRSLAETHRPTFLSHANSELTFNRAQPFYTGMVIYILALLALFASWLWRPEDLRRAAFALLIAGAAIHTLGLVSRVVLQGRPPVTNLYSSAVFVGWGTVVLGILLERIYRRGFGTAVAAAAGFGSLIVAHHLSMTGDTMEMMRAVLDSNFWLATHVITITIGYSGMFLAGALGIAYTLRKHLARALDEGTTKALSSMTYGVLGFSLFFSFVGTVLGGIWADQSWGRFWGWDPKENGALLIVLWCALILHARWAGIAQERGIMAMAIFGNVITSLSWFGVNMLGVGLHSYGFMDKAFWSLTLFVASQLLLMGLCLLPRRFWERPSEA